MPYKCIVYSIMIGVAVMNTACAPLWGNDSYVHRRENTYLTSQNGVDLTLPPNLRTHNTVHTHARLPNVTGQAGVSIVPPGSSIAMQQSSNKQIFMPGLKASQFKLHTVAGHPVLTVYARYPEVWFALSNGLSRQGIPVIGQDRKLGYYYVVDTYLTQNRVTKASPVYQIYLHIVAPKTIQLFLLDTQGKPVVGDDARRLLYHVSRGMQGYIKPHVLQWLQRHTK